MIPPATNYTTKMLLQAITLSLHLFRFSAEEASYGNVIHPHGLRARGPSQSWRGASLWSWGHAIPTESGTLGNQHRYGLIYLMEYTRSRAAAQGRPESPAAVLTLRSKAAGTGAPLGKTADQWGTPASAIWPRRVHFNLPGITWATPHLPSKGEKMQS